MVNKVLLHNEICQILNDMYAKKNADYGDSFSKARQEIPNYTLGKIYDKFSRYRNIMNSNPLVGEETIRDTLMDLANYCIMELIEMHLEEAECEYMPASMLSYSEED